MTLEIQEIEKEPNEKYDFLSIKLIDSHAKIPVKIFKIITRAHIAHLENILWEITVKLQTWVGFRRASQDEWNDHPKQEEWEGG